MTNSDKAKRALVRIGTLELEGFQLPDGSYRISQTQVAQSVGKDESNARKFLTSKSIKALLGKGYTPGKERRLRLMPQLKVGANPGSFP